jgi:hypothetical protein
MLSRWPGLGVTHAARPADHRSLAAAASISRLKSRGMASGSGSVPQERASGAVALQPPSHSPDSGYMTAAVADDRMPGRRQAAYTAAIRAHDILTTVILTSDAGASRRLRGRPNRRAPVDALLFLLAQLRAENHSDLCH